jgi:acyl-CoA hydrolase
MQWMDEAAYITAIRCCRKSMVTVKVNDLQFYHPLTTGMIAEIHSSVLSHGMVKLEILVEIYAEDVYLGTSHKAAHAIFTMAAVNKEMKVARLDDK